MHQPEGTQNHPPASSKNGVQEKNTALQGEKGPASPEEGDQNPHRGFRDERL